MGYFGSHGGSWVAPGSGNIGLAIKSQLNANRPNPQVNTRGFSLNYILERDAGKRKTPEMEWGVFIHIKESNYR
ncbi:TPA: hypothetical protein DCR79_02310 [Patescibacteria group bacterium]|uniref:Uncharacterized protein n=1 Tax=Candidatus Woesebacteria bacterium GW2011_GWB1_39_10b TaxID=1618573 RepID=A0A0G0LPY3_9BACT|nr:MAG: hypothetical protein UT19_C0019G0008 [Candidatus Woesebacteria bacterium GW2011_GWB1_39_10b]HAR55095.1 hypothetical protein [Patescibacteria group bacterium]HCR42136.1 hypothetical protein [Patescibacteria group bacterium]